MCLAIPGKVVEIFSENGLKMGKIDYSGTVNAACLEYVPEVKAGEYVIVHAGFAISIIDEAEAMKTLELWNDMAEKAAEEGLDIFGMPLNEKRDIEK
ncbi:MAG: HypC/HybG/HupF family hydrogenase formation chaperone [Candidatus Zixiibacteriota bacterium]|nr:MAG: HypC/HybG/HupF family hydrogenase formation chaperone [candidate division Zixibacteria bacterium]